MSAKPMTRQVWLDYLNKAIDDFDWEADEMTETVKAKYKASTPGKSSIEVDHGSLPLELNKLIVWIMTKPERALELVREYEQLRNKL